MSNDSAPTLDEAVGRLTEFADMLALQQPIRVLGCLDRAHVKSVMISGDLRLLLSALVEMRGARDAAYVKMIDTAGFLRGYGDVCEVAARALVGAVPEDFDDREEAVRQAPPAEGSLR